jgi:hypothetical protein
MDSGDREAWIRKVLCPLPNMPKLVNCTNDNEWNSRRIASPDGRYVLHKLCLTIVWLSLYVGQLRSRSFNSRLQLTFGNTASPEFPGETRITTSLSISCLKTSNKLSKIDPFGGGTG